MLRWVIIKSTFKTKISSRFFSFDVICLKQYSMRLLIQIGSRVNWHPWKNVTRRFNVWFICSVQPYIQKGITYRLGVKSIPLRVNSVPFFFWWGGGVSEYRVILVVVAAWLTRRSSNLRIASRMDSNPVGNKPLFPWARNYTQIVPYWLVR